MLGRISALCTAALLATGCALTSAEPDVLAAYAAAIGDPAARADIRGVEIDITLTEPTFTVEGHYLALRDGRMRVDIYADGDRVFTEAFDGEAGWQLHGGETVAVDMSAAGEGAVRRGVLGNLFGLDELGALGHAVSIGEPETMDGVTYDIVDVVFDDGFETRYYLDPDTHLIARTRSETALHPDVDPEVRRTESRIDDYRRIGGVMRSWGGHVVDLATGDVTQTTVVRSVIVNPGLSDDVFTRP